MRTAAAAAAVCLLSESQCDCRNNPTLQASSQPNRAVLPGYRRQGIEPVIVLGHLRERKNKYISSKKSQNVLRNQENDPLAAESGASVRCHGEPQQD